VIYGERIGMPVTVTPPPITPVNPIPPDTNPPTITLDPLTSTTVSSNPTITGTETDLNGLDQADAYGLRATASVDGGAAQNVIVSTTGQFSFTTTFATDGTADGQHTVTFIGYDAAGNASQPQSVTFTLTTTNNGSLTVTLDPGSDTGTQGDNITTLSTITLDGTAPDNTLVTLTQTGATTTSSATGAYSFTNVALTSGPNTFNVTATGPTGNSLAANVTVTLDTAPTVSQAIANFQVSEGAANSVFNMPTVFEDTDVNAVVQITTNRGTFEVELFGQQTPITVANFISYVEGTDSAGSNYDNTIFHRVTNVSTDGIGVLQGGGFKLTTNPTALTAIATASPITDEAGLTNALGTIAMARTSDPNSATSQFFFNTVDNATLDLGGGASPQGYAVFGVVLGDGMSVVDASAAVPPVNQGGNFSAIPLSGGFQPNDPNFPGDTTQADYEYVVSATPLIQPNSSFADKLTFAVSNNTNPGLVTPTINADGLLTLAYTAGETGVATITLMATDSAGISAQSTFTVTVGADTTAPTVTITAPANGSSVKASPNITGTATDNLAVTSLTASVDGGAAQTVTFNSTTGRLPHRRIHRHGRGR
jgi:cyclophilin family peptidyl-prolyl cis-trans isomerase